MTRPPPVSVLTTCYNREKFVAQTIESVLGSSFGDFEYIIVDDCSSDGTAEIARGYAKLDSRIEVRVNESNLGDYHNRNRAASLAGGDYIKFVDSDDIIYPHGLQVMIDGMRRFPEAGLGMSRPPMPTDLFPVCLDPAEAYRKHIFGDGLFDNGPTSTIIHRETFQTAGGFSGRRFLGDLEFWLLLARLRPVVLLPRDLIWWRVHEGQEYSLQQKLHTTISSAFKIIDSALEHKECPLRPQEVVSARQVARERFAKELLRWSRVSIRQAASVAWTSGLSWNDFYRVIAAKLAR